MNKQLNSYTVKCVLCYSLAKEQQKKRESKTIEILL